MFNSPGIAQRQDGHVTLYLSKAHPSPPAPFELQGHVSNRCPLVPFSQVLYTTVVATMDETRISQDDWAIRVPALTHLAARYYKPIFERVWLCLAVIITLIVPLASYGALFRAIYGQDEAEASQAFAARLLSFVIFLAGLLLFCAPIFIWKTVGKRRVAVLLASYAASDAAKPSASGFTPKWSMNTPGVFSSRTILTITTPPNAPITSFHPDAYLPTYISKAEEAQGAYFYPYPAASREAGLPRMSVIGGYGAQEKV